MSVSATGTLRPVRIVQVKSKAAGEILRMPAELGDRIEAGALIAQIDTETLDQELAQAQADLESAQVRLDVSERQYNRAQALSEQDLVSMQDLDTSEQNYTTSKGSCCAPRRRSSCARSASTTPRCGRPAPARLSARRWSRA